MLSYYRQKVIEELIAKNGGCCVYCKVEVRRNWTDGKHDNDATIDHVVAKAKGGKNEMANYALACRRCNHNKGDRSVEGFLADPRSPTERAKEARKIERVRVKTVPVPETVTTGFRYLMPLPRGATLPPEPRTVAVFEHSAYQAPRKLTGVELARAVAKIVDPPRRKRRRKPTPIIGIEFAKLYTRPLGVPLAYPDDPKAQAAFEGVYKNRLHLLRPETPAGEHP